MAESGFPGFEAISWFGIAFPAGTPPEIVERMNKEVVKAMAEPELRKKLEAAGITPASSTAVAFSEHVKNEIGRWRAVITDAKVTTE